MWREMETKASAEKAGADERRAAVDAPGGSRGGAGQHVRWGDDGRSVVGPDKIFEVSGRRVFYCSTIVRAGLIIIATPRFFKHVIILYHTINRGDRGRGVYVA